MSSTASPLQGKNADAKMSAKHEPRTYIKKSVGAVDKDQDSCVPTKKLRTTNCAHASFGNETKPFINEEISTHSGTSVLIKDDAPQSLIPQNSHHRITLAETTNSSFHSKSVPVKHNTATLSLPSEVPNAGSQGAVCSPNKPSSITKSDMSSTAVAKWLKYHFNETKSFSSCAGVTSSDVPCKKEDLCEKSKVDMEINNEPENRARAGNCVQSRCSAVERMEQKSGIIKSHARRTYSGPIQRRVVRTKEGGKRTIMIVKKASLKNLQAKGLIQPIRKYMADHPDALQSLRKTNFLQSVSDNIKNFSGQTSENLISRKGGELGVKNSSIKQSIICECHEPRTKSSCNQNACSHSATQTSNIFNPNENFSDPGKASCVNANGCDALSVRVPIQLPRGVNRSCGTGHLPQQQTSLNSGIHCTVSQAKTQALAPVDPNQPSSSQLANISEISSNILEVCNKESISPHAVIQNFPQMSASASSSQYEVHPSAVNTNVPSTGHEISSDPVQISPEENSSTHNCSVLSSMSSAANISTATCTSKPPDFHPCQVKDPSLLTKINTGMKKSDSSTVDAGDTMGDKLTKTRPQNRDNVQWIAMPSSSAHQPQPSSSGINDQEEQTDSTNKNRMAAITLTSSEQPGVVYKAIPLTSLLPKGQKLHATPTYTSANKELKLKYTRLLKKHRYRYHLLLKKYKALEQKFSAVGDIGTPQQVIRDAHKFLSEEHVLFLESQMFLRNRPGTGNRFSRKFMKLMIEYYKRSAAGYKFLRTIFSIPSVPTVQKWMNKPVEFRNLNSAVPEGNGTDEANPPPKFVVSSTSQDSYSNQNFSKRKGAVQNMEFEESSSDGDNSEESSLEDDGS